MIPLGARIIAICDSFHAMMDERVYKPAMSLSDALAELRRCSGSQFDPQLVEVFCRLVTERTSREHLHSETRRGRRRGALVARRPRSGRPPAPR